MSPLPEGSVSINWQGTEAEARQFFDQLNATPAGGAFVFESEGDGRFTPSAPDASLGAIEEKVEAAAPGWETDGRLYLDVDPVRGSIS